MGGGKPKYKRAASDGAWRAARSRVKTRARYGEPCGLCGKPIDLTLRRPDPMAFEADHIVPVSMGGHRTKQSNLQPAHALCNGQKGNGQSRRYIVGRCKHGCDMHNARTAAMHDPASEPAYPGVWRWNEVHGCWSPASRAW